MPALIAKAGRYAMMALVLLTEAAVLSALLRWPS